MGLLDEVGLLVRRTFLNNGFGFVGEREGPGQNLDHWTTAHDPHRLGSIGTVGFRRKSFAVHLAVVVFSVLLVLLVAVGIRISCLMLLSLPSTARVSADACAASATEKWFVIPSILCEPLPTGQ